MKATLHTNYGDIVAELFPDHAPKTVANFVGLAKGEKETPRRGSHEPDPVLQRLSIHRVIPGFMIQGG